MKSDYKKHQRETISPQLRPLITSPKKMAKKLSLYPENGKRKSFFFFSQDFEDLQHQIT